MFIEGSGINRIRFAVVCSMILVYLAACANASHTADLAEKRDPSIITVEKADARVVPVNEIFDLLCGITHQDDTPIVYGMREKRAVFLYLDNDGRIKEERSIGTEIIKASEPVIYELAAANDSLYALFGPAQRSTGKELFQFCVIDKNGNTSVIADVKDGDFWNYGSYVSPDNTIWFWYGSSIIRFDENGSVQTKELPVNDDIISLSCRDGKTNIFFLNGNESKVYEYNETDESFSEIMSINMETGLAACQCQSVDNNLLLNSETHLLEFNYETHEIEKRFSWAQIDLSGDLVRGILEIGSNHFICVIPERNEIFFLTTREEEIKRTRITIGALENSFANDVEYCVSLFNEQNSEYYADVHYYSDNTELSTAFATGDAPDVLEMSQVEIPLKQEYFMNIAPLLQEKEIEAEDFTGCLWMAMQREQQLLMLPDSVRIDTITARSKDVGRKMGWSWDEMYEIVKHKGETVNVFPDGMTAEEVMLWMSANSLGRFINYADMTCDFEDEEFIRYLTFCKDATKGSIEENGAYSENTLLEIEGIGIPWRIVVIGANYHGDDYTFIGFPDDAGGYGSFYRCANTGLRLSIPQNAKSAKGAAEFLAFLLSEKWQNHVLELPVMESALNKKMEKIETPDGTIATDSDIQKMNELINSTKVFVYEDLKILDIVREEAGAYLNGEKTPEEVASVIQNRVTVYLQEKSD